MGQVEQHFRVGSIHATVFSNDIDTPDGARKVRSVGLQKRYRDKDGNFRPTSILHPNDIPKAILALVMAYDYLMTAPSPPNNP